MGEEEIKPLIQEIHDCVAKEMFRRGYLQALDDLKCSVDDTQIGKSCSIDKTQLLNLITKLEMEVI